MLKTFVLNVTLWAWLHSASFTFGIKSVCQTCVDIFEFHDTFTIILCIENRKWLNANIHFCWCRIIRHENTAGCCRISNTMFVLIIPVNCLSSCWWIGRCEILKVNQILNYFSLTMMNMTLAFELSGSWLVSEYTRNHKAYFLIFPCHAILYPHLPHCFSYSVCSLHRLCHILCYRSNPL